MARSNRQRSKQRQAARRAERRLNPYLDAPPEEEFDDTDADLIEDEPAALATERLGYAEDARAYAGRGRVAAFLASVWLELKRVEWPDRRTVTLLTGVVLGFVLVAGGYLGLLDLIFSKLVQRVL